MTSPDHAELISVILPVFNAERTIEASVASVLMQSCKDLELIIIDDASVDDTRGILSSLAGQDSRIRIITNQENCGALRSRLTGADKANGEWIAFIDADDMWDPAKLEKQIKLRDSAGCDLIYTGSSFIDENGTAYDWIMHVPDTVDYKGLLKQNIISNSSVLMRKSDYIRYSPPADDGDSIHEDYACWLSMLKAGLSACGIDEPLITYRVSGESRTGNKRRSASMNMNTYKYIGIGPCRRVYYEVCYAKNGYIKHRHFKMRATKK